MQVIDTEGKKKGRPKGSTNRTDVTVAAQVRARREVLRINRTEDMRERIQGGSILTRLEGIQAKLVNLDGVELDAIQVQRLGKAAEISLRLLCKILPDLKSVEVTKRTEEAITIDQVSESERQSINDAISRALGIADDGGGSPAQDIQSQKYITPIPRHEISENVIDGEYQECGDGGDCSTVGYDSSS